jgi:hypothetical protein
MGDLVFVRPAKPLHKGLADFTRRPLQWLAQSAPADNLAMSTNDLGLIVSIVMVVVFALGWAAIETTRRNNAEVKYKDADPQLRHDMINKSLEWECPSKL